jgi:putative protease
VEKKNNIELMAPAGGFDSLQAALDNGADSVYFA